jgi:hypothetical protein
VKTTSTIRTLHGRAIRRRLKAIAVVREILSERSLSREQKNQSYY